MKLNLIICTLVALIAASPTPQFDDDQDQIVPWYSAENSYYNSPVPNYYDTEFSSEDYYRDPYTPMQYNYYK
jgi:hypothetical protein